MNIFKFNGGNDEGEPIDLQEAFKTGKWPFPVAIPCRICGKNSRNIRHVGFCRKHWQESRRRQSDGVPLEELSPLWNDTMAAWKDRPEEVADEPAELFHYSKPEGDWHLFDRGYPTRLPDWLAYNAKTGEIRRFVGVGLEEVLEDLLGGNPAPHQEEMIRHWGTPEPDFVHAMVQRMADQVASNRLPAFSDVVQEYGIAVYGLYGSDLEPVSFEYGGRGGREVHVAMRYGPPKVPVYKIAAFVQSGTSPYKVINQEPEYKQWQVMSFAETLLFYAGHATQRERLARGGEKPRFDERYGEGVSLRVGLTLHDFKSILVRRWMVPEPLTVLLAESDDAVLRVGALGFEDQEIQDLVSQLRRIDNDREALRWHDELFERRRREIEERWSDGE